MRLIHCLLLAAVVLEASLVFQVVAGQNAVDNGQSASPTSSDGGVAPGATQQNTTSKKKATTATKTKTPTPKAGSKKVRRTIRMQEVAPPAAAAKPEEPAQPKDVNVNVNANNKVQVNPEISNQTPEPAQQPPPPSAVAEEPAPAQEEPAQQQPAVAVVEKPAKAEEPAKVEEQPETNNLEMVPYVPQAAAAQPVQPVQPVQPQPMVVADQPQLPQQPTGFGQWVLNAASNQLSNRLDASKNMVSNLVDGASNQMHNLLSNSGNSVQNVAENSGNKKETIVKNVGNSETLHIDGVGNNKVTRITNANNNNETIEEKDAGGQTEEKREDNELPVRVQAAEPSKVDAGNSTPLVQITFNQNEQSNDRNRWSAGPFLAPILDNGALVRADSREALLGPPKSMLMQGGGWNFTKPSWLQDLKRPRTQLPPLLPAPPQYMLVQPAPFGSPLAANGQPMLSATPVLFNPNPMMTMQQFSPPMMPLFPGFPPAPFVQAPFPWMPMMRPPPPGGPMVAMVPGVGPVMLGLPTGGHMPAPQIQNQPKQPGAKPKSRGRGRKQRKQQRRLNSGDSDPEEAAADSREDKDESAPKPIVVEPVEPIKVPSLEVPQEVKQLPESMLPSELPKPLPQLPATPMVPASVPVPQKLEDLRLSNPLPPTVVVNPLSQPLQSSTTDENEDDDEEEEEVKWVRMRVPKSKKKKQQPSPAPASESN